MELPRAIEIVPSGPVGGTVTAPSSKSLTNRALVCAALADGETTIAEPLDADDTRAMALALQALGARVTFEPDRWLVVGTGGALRAPSDPLDCRLSGTTLRFLTAVGALAGAPVRLTGGAPLLRRPLGPLASALVTLGATVVTSEAGVEVTGGLGGGTIVVDGSGSSQFVSAVMLAAPYASGDVTVRAEGVSATGYIALTAELMRAFGADVEDVDATTWRVRAGEGYRARDYAVPYDASAAAHLYALAVATGGSITVSNAIQTAQPDARAVEVFEAMGATGSGATVVGPTTPEPVEVSLAAMPDQLPTVAALAALAPGRTTIMGVAVTRAHETDRIAAVATELAKLGVRVEERPDGLAIEGGARGPVRIATYDDHRMAMAFAALGARVEGVGIEDPGCVSKTYPRFWDDVARAGVRWQPA